MRDQNKKQKWLVLGGLAVWLYNQPKTQNRGLCVSIAGVPFDSFQDIYGLLRTTRMRIHILGSVSSVAALVTNKQIIKQVTARKQWVSCNLTL